MTCYMFRRLAHKQIIFFGIYEINPKYFINNGYIQTTPNGYFYIHKKILGNSHFILVPSHNLKHYIHNLDKNNFIETLKIYNRELYLQLIMEII